MPTIHPGPGFEEDLRAPVMQPAEYVGPERRLAKVQGDRIPAFGRTLTVALAMRGGVSLAVWIGGVVAELDVLRRIHLVKLATSTVNDATMDVFPLIVTGRPKPRELDESDKRAVLYARLLAEARYDSVEFDILAGASAGGLNGVLYAAAQRAGAPIERMRDTWEHVGSLLQLLHPPGVKPVDSLLRGDKFFWGGALRAMVTSHDSDDGHADLVAPRITLDLSATIIDGADSSDPDPQEGRGAFHFEGGAAIDGIPTLGRLIPERAFFATGKPRTTPAADTINDLRRLAYAARSTSSFPGAFEPAHINSFTTPSTFDGRPDMRHAFGAQRIVTDPTRPFRVSDGGVFDNIPVGRALDAAEAHEHAAAGDRVLMYVDPNPPLSDSLDGVWRERLNRLVPSVIAAVSRFKRREDASDEVDELRAFNDDVAVSEGRLEALSTSPILWAPAAMSTRLRAYSAYRAAADGALLDRVLRRPGAWQLTSRLADRKRFPAVPDDVLVQLVARLRTELATRSWVETSPQTWVDSANILLAGFRYRDEFLASFADYLDSPEPPGPGRVALSAGLARATLFRDERIAAVLEAYSSAVGVATDGAVGPATTTRGAMPDEPQLGASRDFIEAAVDLWSSPGEPTADVEVKLAVALVELRAAITSVDSQVSTSGNSTMLLDWHRAPWSQLAGDQSIWPVDLPAWLAPAGIPLGTSPLDYWHIAADERTGILPVSELRALEIRRRLRRALSFRVETGTFASAAAQPEFAEFLYLNRLSPKTKLAGAGLAAFRGFLKQSWRTTDWWWGRADAAASVPRFLGRKVTGMATFTADDLVDDTVTALQSSVRTEAGSDEVFSLAAERLDAISPSDRITMASRSIRVVARALDPRSPGVRILANVFLSLVNFARVLLPVLVTPPRALLVATLLGFAGWLSAWDDPHKVMAQTWVLVCVTIIWAVGALIILIVMWFRASRTWKRMDAFPASTDDALVGRDELITIAKSHRAAAYKKAALLTVLSALGGAPVVVAIWHSHLGLAIVAAIVSWLAAVAVGPVARSVSTPPTPEVARRWIAPVVILFLALAGSVVAGLWLSAHPEPDAFRFWWLTGTLLIVAVALTWDWLTSHRRFWIPLGNTFLAAIAGCLTLKLGGSFTLAALAMTVVWGTALWWLPETEKDPTNPELLYPTTAA